MGDERNRRFPSVLGVYLGHDLGACLLQGGAIVAAIEEERLNRFRHGRPNKVAGLWPEFAGRFGYVPWASITYCLRTAELGLNELDLIMFGDEIWGAAAASTVNELVPVRDARKVMFTPRLEGGAHHYHHALSAFLSSPFPSAAVLVVDGDGTRGRQGYEAESGFYFEDRTHRGTSVFKNCYEESLPRAGVGWMYEQVTLLLGFGNSDVYVAEPGKTMGLAPYGQRHPDLREPWLAFSGHSVDFAGFHDWVERYGLSDAVLPGRASAPFSVDGATQGGLGGFGADIALKAQSELERAMLHLARFLRESTGATRLCLAGGVALNAVANGLIRRSGLFEEVFVVPPANDSGQAVGLAYHAHLTLQESNPGSPDVAPMDSAFLGREYSPADVDDVVRRSRIEWTEFDKGRLERDAASRLARGDIVGWFQGRSEFGPRALGNRSVLADPRPAAMKDRINSLIKHREAFRPFAPAVLAERAEEVFEMSGPSPFMQFVAPVRESWRGLVPAIVHVDGTARLQTVSADRQPLLHSLISEFEVSTGVPLLLNTSFNLCGMPIVETPFDALECFVMSELDVLYLGGVRLLPPLLDLVVPDWNVSWSLVRRQGEPPHVEWDCPSGRKRSLEIAESLSSALEAVNGEESVASLAGGGRREQVAVGRMMRHLCRAGAVKLRVGALEFGRPSWTRHWWQRGK
ncbi:MAG: carbamoyltransferase C-terminal domain-containing protein [Planctomycetota bacterium]